MHDSLHPELTFAEAADVWLNSRTMSPGSRARYISPRTLMDLLQYIRALNRKFGAAHRQRGRRTSIRWQLAGRESR